MTNYQWIACLCYVWPVSPYFNLNRCGLCKTVPDTHVPPPKSGRAMTIRDYMAENDD